jgi:hypothetical protein
VVGSHVCGACVLRLQVGTSSGFTVRLDYVGAAVAPHKAPPSPPLLLDHRPGMAEVGISGGSAAGNGSWWGVSAVASGGELEELGWDEAPEAAPMGALARWLLGMGMTLPLVALNLRGAEFVGGVRAYQWLPSACCWIGTGMIGKVADCGKVAPKGWARADAQPFATQGAVALSVLVVAPFVVLVAVGAPAVTWEKMLAPTPEPRWGTYLTVLLWNTCGFGTRACLSVAMVCAHA